MKTATVSPAFVAPLSKPTTPGTTARCGIPADIMRGLSELVLRDLDSLQTGFQNRFGKDPQVSVQKLSGGWMVKVSGPALFGIGSQYACNSDKSLADAASGAFQCALENMQRH